MKLEIKSIKFRNFFSYGKILQEVDFTPGLNLILGNDVTKDRSNAVGKSGFLETIPFALFGKVNRNVRKEAIINWKNRKNCEVYLEFSKGGIEFAIHRGLRPDFLKVYKNGRLLPTPSHKIDYQREIEEEIIGMDFKSFISLIYSNPNSSQPILGMTADKKRKFIETVFGLELFTLLNNKCNEKMKLASDKMFTFKTKKEYLDKNIEDREKYIAGIKAQLKNMASVEDELVETKKEYNKVKNENRNLQYDANVKKLIEKSNELRKLTREHGDIEADIKMTEKDISLVNRQIEAIGDLREDQNMKSEISRLYKELITKHGEPEAIDKTIEKLTAENKDINISLDMNRKILDEITEKIGKETANISSTSVSLEALMGMTECPTCGTIINPEKVSKDMEVKSKEARKRLSALEKKKKEAEALMRELKDKRAENDEQSRVLMDGKVEIITLGSRIASYKHLGEAAEKQKELRKELKDLNKILEGKNKDYAKVKKCIQKCEKEIGTLNELIAAAKEVSEKLTKLSDKLALLKEKQKYEKESRNRLTGLIKDSEEKIKGYLSEKTELNLQISKISNVSDYLDYIKIICKDDNVKQYAISSIMPYLNSRVNHYLSEVGHSFYIEFNNFLDEVIRGPGMADCVYGSLSGGESKSVDFALQMALLDIARIQAGVFPDVLLLDEILDSSVDSYGLEKIMGIVKLKQREDESKTFLVSHRKEVSDIDVDRCYLIEKKDGFSYVRLQ